jgi:hypothetical protein
MVRDVHVLFLDAGNVELGGDLLCPKKGEAQNAVSMSTSIAATLTLVPSADSLNSTLRGGGGRIICSRTYIYMGRRETHIDRCLLK